MTLDWRTVHDPHSSRHPKATPVYTIMVKGPSGETAIEPSTAVSSAQITRTPRSSRSHGKGGIGEVQTLANLSYMMAQPGERRCC